MNFLKYVNIHITDNIRYNNHIINKYIPKSNSFTLKYPYNIHIKKYVYIQNIVHATCPLKKYNKIK